MENDRALLMYYTILFRDVLMVAVNTPIRTVIYACTIPLFVNSLSREDNSDLQFESALILTQICNGSRNQTKVVIEAGAIPVLVRLLSEEELKEQAVCVLGNIAVDFRDLVLQGGVIRFCFVAKETIFLRFKPLRGR